MSKKELKEEIDAYFSSWTIHPGPYGGYSLTEDDVVEIAEYFYELGRMDSEYNPPLN